MMAYYGDQGNENYGGKWEPRRSSGGGMSDLPYWILALVFLFAFPPVGVLMIALRLFGGGKRRVARGRHPYYMARYWLARVCARTTVSEPARSQEKTGRREKKRQEGKAEQDMSPVCLDVVEKMAKRGRRLIQVGGIITAVFAFTVLACLGDASYWLLHGDAIWFWDQLLNAIPLLCFLGGGAGVLWAGLRKKKQVRTYRNYLAMIGRRQTISISTLASATGASPAKVRDCLEDMLDDGLFPLGFLDYGGDRLVLSGEGLNDPAPAQEGKTEEKKAAPVDEENAVLAEIRAVNDSIEDAALSAQIDRIGVITAKVCPAPCLSELLPAHNPEDPPGLCPAGVPGRRGGEHCRRHEPDRGDDGQGGGRLREAAGSALSRGCYGHHHRRGGSGADAPEGWTVLLRRDADWNLTDSKAAGIFPAAFTFLLLPDRTARTGR